MLQSLHNITVTIFFPVSVGTFIALKAKYDKVGNKFDLKFNEILLY